MKKIFMILSIMLILVACQSPVYQTIQQVQADPNDPRLTSISAMSARFLRLPNASRGIEVGDPIAEFCTELGWSYLFYDDGAVIGFEPFPDNISVMHNAVRITVESHNMEFPELEWGFINVAIPVIPPDTSNDPILDVWQVALCLDDGTVVEGPYTAEFDFNWIAFKSYMPTQLASYNLDHDPDAHLVWGPEKVE